MHGKPKYGENFKHFEYVNPFAPKGGKLINEAMGTFDSFNPFILKGVKAAGLGLIYDSLMVGSSDDWQCCTDWLGLCCAGYSEGFFNVGWWRIG